MNAAESARRLFVPAALFDFAALGIAHALAGSIGWTFVTMTVVDLVFAALFWRFLRAYPAAPPPEPAADAPPPA